MADVYDGVFRTIINDCSWFVLPLINEVFGEHYSGTETIEFHPNEHFISQNDEPDSKRITDTNFTVTGSTVKKYHLECESSKYSTRILVRIFEYDAQIALDESEIEGETIRVTFPNTAVLYLRNSRKTPDSMKVRIIVPGDSAEYTVPIIKMADYTADDIFRKKLYMLIPFYIFNFEKQFEIINQDEEKLKEVVKEYRSILKKLSDLTEKEEITSFDKRTIADLSGNVIEELAKNYEKVQKGVGEVMGGPMIETEAKRILMRGRDEGRVEGRVEGKSEGRSEGKELKDIENILRVMKKQRLTLEGAIDALTDFGSLNITEEKKEEYIEKLSNPESFAPGGDLAEIMDRLNAE